MTRATDPKDAASFETLARALDQFRKGETDLGSAARDAGLEEWAFLEEAQALPEPTAAQRDNDLPVFIRDKR